ncbi:MAG: hypothetical protein WA814_02795 [Candidatus Baltobacteraceae bacterium]
MNAFMVPLLVAAIASPAPAAAPNAQPVTWNGITLGAPAAALRASLGDPLRVVVFNDGKRRIGRYAIPGSSSAFFLVTEERGYVIGFAAFVSFEGVAAPTGPVAGVPPDPSGAQIGATFDSVKAAHPGFHAETDQDNNPILVGRISPQVGAAYTFVDNRLRMLQWDTQAPENLPELAPLSDPEGTSVATAILDAQKNESDGVAWEYRYLAFHPCAENARWIMQNQSLVNDNGHAYDRLHVVCSTTKAERDFFFDIGSYFGKP